MNAAPFCEFCGKPVGECICESDGTQNAQPAQLSPNQHQGGSRYYSNDPNNRPQGYPSAGAPPYRPRPQQGGPVRRPEYPQEGYNPNVRGNQGNQTMGMMKDLSGQGLNTAKQFFKSPSRIMERACYPGSFQQGLFFYAVKAVVMGILAPLLLSSVLKEMMGPLYRDSMGFSDGLSIFLRVLLFSLVADAAYFGVVFVAGKLFKSGADPKSMIGVFGVCSIPLTCAIVGGGILAMVSFKLGVIVFVAALCYCAAVNYQALDNILGLDDDRLLLAMAVIHLVMIALTYFAGKTYLEDLVSAIPFLR